MTSLACTSMRAPSLLLLSLAAAALAGGCGPARSMRPFGHAVPDDDADAVTVVTSRLARAGEAAPASRPVVLGVGASPASLWAYDLEARRVLWNEPTELDTQPYLCGNYVVAQEGPDAVVRRLADGHVTARIPDRELSLVGAAGEGDLGALVLSTTAGGAGASSILLILDHGSPSARHDVDHALGRPAMHAGLLFVPWAHQNVSVIELASGEEIARVRSTEHVIGTAIASGADVYVGSTELVRFGPELVTGGARWYVPPAVERAARVAMLFDAYTRPPAARSAAHQVRMAFTPVRDGEGTGLLEDTLIQIFYRAAFGLEARGPGARWVTVNEHDIVGVAHDPTGVVLVDEAGRIVVLLPADGRVGLVLETGIPSSYAEVWLGDWAPALSAAGPSTPVHDELVALAQDGDARLVPARAFAMRLLARSPEADVTDHLLSLCDNAGLPAELHTAACDALASRTSGAERVIAALGRRASFLDAVSAPPVGALARAAVAMRDARAVPLLVRHLSDPATAAADLPAVFEALASFHDPSAVAPVAAFLRLYHAEPAESDLAPALVAAAFAYAELAGGDAVAPLQALAGDATTAPELIAAAGEAAELAAGGGSGGDAEVVASTDTEVTPLGVAEDLPRHLTAAMVAEALLDERHALEQCLVTPGRVHGLARVVLVVEPSGELSMVSVSPVELTECIEPRMRSVSYPATSARTRQRVTYEISRHR